MRRGELWEPLARVGVLPVFAYFIDRAVASEHLKLAERHVAEGRQRVEAQRARRKLERAATP